MPYPVKPWAEIAQHYQRGTILLGNGASIAVSQSFAYRSLLEHVRENELLQNDVARLFEFLRQKILS